MSWNTNLKTVNPRCKLFTKCSLRVDKSLSLTLNIVAIVWCSSCVFCNNKYVLPCDAIKRHERATSTVSPTRLAISADQLTTGSCRKIGNLADCSTRCNCEINYFYYFKLKQFLKSKSCLFIAIGIHALVCQVYIIPLFLFT